MSELFIQVVIEGLLWGAIYALVAVGLSLIWGVMGILNLAHGDFLMLGMFGAYWLAILLGIDPLIGLLIVTPAMFILGLGIYKSLITRIVKAPRLTALLATFGLGIFLRNLAHFLWRADYRMLGDTLVGDRVITVSILGGTNFISVPKLLAAVGSLAATALLYWFIKRTRTGRALQATAMNRQAAALMGIDTERMYMLAYSLGIACVGVAGVLLTNFFIIFPEVGIMFVLFALVAVTIGGFGSIHGALIGGLIIGLIESVGGFVGIPALKQVLVFAVFVIVVVLRPRGLFGWAD